MLDAQRSIHVFGLLLAGLLLFAGTALAASERTRGGPVEEVDRVMTMEANSMAGQADSLRVLLAQLGIHFTKPACRACTRAETRPAGDPHGQVESSWQAPADDGQNAVVSPDS